MSDIRLGSGALSDVCLGDESISALYLGTALVWDGPDYPPGLPRLAGIGDSTIAEYPLGEGIHPVPTLIAGVAPTVLAVPGQNAEQQRQVWLAAEGKKQFRAVVIQIGLNDVPQRTDSEAIVSIQSLVDTVRTGIRSDATLLISQMLPAKQRWYDAFPASQAPILQQRWVDINAAIAGTGPSPILRVDGRITAHVAQLDDGTGRLAAQYQSSLTDGIHENNAARQIIADAWRVALVASGVVT